MSAADWLAEAIALAEENVAAGGGPFGALVLRDGVVIGRGANRVTATNDPTAHAEVVAIREACGALGDFSLRGCVLVASCEPCPMCLTAALWSRVDEILYAADRHTAARAGFDDSVFYDVFTTDRATWPVRVAHRPTGTEKAPFTAWDAAATARTDY